MLGSHTKESSGCPALRMCRWSGRTCSHESILDSHSQHLPDNYLSK